MTQHIKQIEEWEQVLENAEEQPVLVFKHSTT